MKNPSDDYEWWYLDAPFGCGAVRTRGGSIQRGGAPIFHKFTGQHIHNLNIKGRYTYEYLGQEDFQAFDAPLGEIHKNHFTGRRFVGWAAEAPQQARHRDFE